MRLMDHDAGNGRHPVAAPHADQAIPVGAIVAHNAGRKPRHRHVLGLILVLAPASKAQTRRVLRGRSLERPGGIQLGPSHGERHGGSGARLCQQRAERSRRTGKQVRVGARSFRVFCGVCSGESEVGGRQRRLGRQPVQRRRRSHDEQRRCLWTAGDHVEVEVGQHGKARVAAEGDLFTSPHALAHGNEGTTMLEVVVAGYAATVVQDACEV
mmetsp:Transcript_27484/g.88332  ORF Transcript_27484/g.88332 Transcript_27484/m.88332 type:complete len:212 (+) Transcript_27484:395-1030(+)